MTDVSQPPEELHELVHHLILTSLRSPSGAPPQLCFYVDISRSNAYIVCTSLSLFHLAVAQQLLQPRYARWLRALRGSGKGNETIECAIRSLARGFPFKRRGPYAMRAICRSARSALSGVYEGKINTQEVSRLCSRHANPCTCALCHGG